MIDSLWGFVGVLHPLLVHFPVALLSLAALAELARWRWKSISPQISPACLLVAAACAILALIAGLARSNSFPDTQLIFNHKWGAITLTLLTLLAACAGVVSLRRPQSVPWRRARMAGVFLAAGLMALVGHWGSELTHGEGFLGAAWSAVVSDATNPPPSSATPATDGRVDFRTQVYPIFEANCFECHGSLKAKQDLRLHTRRDALKGGRSGPPWTPGDSANSLILQMLRPEFPEDIMPPPETGKTITDEQVELIRRWIDEGAHWPE